MYNKVINISSKEWMKVFKAVKQHPVECTNETCEICDLINRTIHKYPQIGSFIPPNEPMYKKLVR